MHPWEAAVTHNLIAVLGDGGERHKNLKITVELIVKIHTKIL